LPDTKPIPLGHTIWDREWIPGPKTIQEILDHYKSNYGGIRIDYLNTVNPSYTILDLDWEDKTILERMLKMTPLEIA